MNLLFKDKLPRDLHISFEIIKLMIKKGNLNLIHNKNTYQHFNYLSRKRKLDKLYNDGFHKARLVAGGHLTPDPTDSIYSGVVSTRSRRLSIFLAKLNNMKVWGADIGNAYLEATTKEKVYLVGGPEFEELQGHILVIHKALYGLKSQV